MWRSKSYTDTAASSRRPVLEDYLDNKVFASANSSTLLADARDIEGFSAFLDRYRRAFPVERAAAELI